MFKVWFRVGFKIQDEVFRVRDKSSVKYSRICMSSVGCVQSLGSELGLGFKM